MLEQETLSLPDIVEIMGERPFPMKETVQEYLRELKERQVVDASLKEETDRQKAEQEERKKEEDKNLKFDIDAAEKAEEAEKKENKRE